MNDKLRLFIWRNNLIIKENIIHDVLNFKETGKKPLQFRNFLTNQIGGGKKLKITYEDNEYIFEEAMDKNYYVLWSKDEIECSTVVIDKENGYAEVHNISNYEACLATTNTNIGSTLLRITIAMLKKYKDKLNVKKIVLTDNSVKKCGNKNITLSTMMILLTGDTWYGKYGFRPREERFIKKYNNNKTIINSIKLEDIDLIKYLNKTELSKDIIKISKKFIKDHPKMLLKDYLTKFIKDFDKTCEYFYNFYEDLFDDLGLYDFRGRTFILDICL
jgi:hypothetical protein